MSVSTAQQLYSRDVLRLALSLPHDDRIEAPYHGATRRSPVCGSEMSVDVAMKAGKIAAVAIRARACALGQASASILRDIAKGQSALEIEAVAMQVRSALNGEGPMPNVYQMLAYARDYPARHGAILLPFDALLAALAEASPS
jgi:NifU-like protein involved in Fe-S cluster formation